MTTILIITGWLICGLVTYGLTFACFQHAFPSIAKEYEDKDRRRALYTGMFGPIGLVAIITLLFSEGYYFKHGLKF